MRDVTKITIVFENCEYIDFVPQDFGTFLLDDITTSISRIACNSIAEMKHANTVALEIFDTKINTEYNPFDIENEKQKVINRFAQCDDITSIIVEFNDNTKESFYVAWGEDEYVNEFQKTQLGKNGNLYIVISKEETIENYFTAENMDDKEFSKISKDLIMDWGESIEPTFRTEF